MLEEAEAETQVAEMSRPLAIREGIFYRWEAKYEGLEVGEARRLRQMEEENR